MTKNRKAKREARALSRATGISYTAALRSRVGGAGGSEDDVDWDNFTPKSLEELLAGSPQGLGDDLIGEEIGVPGSRSTIELEVPDDMREPTVHAFEIPDITMSVQVDEEFDGGTFACNGSATGTMTVQVLMSKEDADDAVAAGRVTMLDASWDVDDSAVGFNVAVEIRFQAIVNQDYEGVEDVIFDGLIVLSG